MDKSAGSITEPREARRRWFLLASCRTLLILVLYCVHPRLSVLVSRDSDHGFHLFVRRLALSLPLSRRSLPLSFRIPSLSSPLVLCEIRRFCFLLLLFDSPPRFFARYAMAIHVCAWIRSDTRDKDRCKRQERGKEEPHQCWSASGMTMWRLPTAEVRKPWL